VVLNKTTAGGHAVRLDLGLGLILTRGYYFTGRKRFALSRPEALVIGNITQIVPNKILHISPITLWFFTLFDNL
jgi:hypothetical protein